MPKGPIFNHKRVRTGKKIIEAFSVALQSKNFVLLRGKRGFVMCGYLDLSAAEKFKDAAVVIKGVSSIEEALKTQVFDCTSVAKSLGIFKGQSIKEAISILA